MTGYKFILILVAFVAAVVFMANSNGTKFATNNVPGIAVIYMDNNSHVVLTATGCPYVKDENLMFGYVLLDDGEYVADVCWASTQDKILVVTLQGEYKVYPIRSAIPTENNNNYEVLDGYRYRL